MQFCILVFSGEANVFGNTKQVGEVIIDGMKKVTSVDAFITKTREVT